MRRIALCAAIVLSVSLLAAPAPAGASREGVAALQAGLQGLHPYQGYGDGVKGPLPRRAITAFQRRNHLAVDGVAGPQTRQALGWRGRPALGSRVMKSGDRGWDVAALQYLLQRAGHGPGRADGLFGPLTDAAVERAQGAAGLGVDGLAGPQTISFLRSGSSSTSTPVSTTTPSGPGSLLRPGGPPTRPIGRA